MAPSFCCEHHVYVCEKPVHGGEDRSGARAAWWQFPTMRKRPPVTIELPDLAGQQAYQAVQSSLRPAWEGTVTSEAVALNASFG
jgi:hypothetical protein